VYKRESKRTETDDRLTYRPGNWHVNLRGAVLRRAESGGYILLAIKPQIFDKNTPPCFLETPEALDEIRRVEPADRQEERQILAGGEKEGEEGQTLARIWLPPTIQRAQLERLASGECFSIYCDQLPRQRRDCTSQIGELAGYRSLREVTSKPGRLCEEGSEEDFASGIYSIRMGEVLMCPLNPTHRGKAGPHLSAFLGRLNSASIQVGRRIRLEKLISDTPVEDPIDLGYRAARVGSTKDTHQYRILKYRATDLSAEGRTIAVHAFHESPKCPYPLPQGKEICVEGVWIQGRDILMPLRRLERPLTWHKGLPYDRLPTYDAAPSAEQEAFGQARLAFQKALRAGDDCPRERALYQQAEENLLRWFVRGLERRRDIAAVFLPSAVEGYGDLEGRLSDEGRSWMVDKEYDKPAKLWQVFKEFSQVRLDILALGVTNPFEKLCRTWFGRGIRPDMPFESALALLDPGERYRLADMAMVFEPGLFPFMDDRGARKPLMEGPGR
jgi:hypothetical protein